MGVNSKLYDRDFYAWTREQAELLRAGRVSELDLVNVAEEIESMGRSEKRELVSRLVVLMLHLAKWRFQPTLRSRSWRLSVEGQRIQITEHLADNPSLRPTMDEIVAQAWRRASLDAQRETGLDASAFPVDCPWTAEQALDDAFWPD
jgi:Domain of unknown function DUF29